MIAVVARRSTAALRACSRDAGCRGLATRPPGKGAIGTTDWLPTRRDGTRALATTPERPEPEYGLGPPQGLLRNVGQVIFMDKPAAGSLALIGLAIGDPYLAGLGFAGGATATITSRAVGFDEEATDNGLMGYNGVLVGCAFSQFLAVSPPVALAATVAGAAAARAVWPQWRPRPRPPAPPQFLFSRFLFLATDGSSHLSSRPPSCMELGGV